MQRAIFAPQSRPGKPLMTMRTRLGEILVDRGLLTSRQLEAALEEQRQRQGGEQLGQILVGLGFLSAEQLTSALTEQTRRWVTAGLTAGILALQPGLLAARTVTAQLSVSVEVLATASVTVQSANAATATAAAPARNVAMSCAGEPLMRITYERAQIVPQPASAVASASPFVPAPPAYKLNLQPLSQSLVPCGTSQKSVALTAPSVQLHGDDMNVEIAY
jgi:hypothetical protein